MLQLLLLSSYRLAGAVVRAVPVVRAGRPGPVGRPG